MKFGFKTIGIWPINPKAMDSKTKPSKVYTTSININNARIEEDYTIEEETENNQQ
jgi:hypothetical protein